MLKIGPRSFAIVAVLGGLACPAKTLSEDGAPASPPRVYVAKVKSLLVGLSPTSEEIASVEADPRALEAWVDTWMTLPEYRQKALRFFELAFQQTQISSNDFADQVYAQLGLNAATTPLLLQNAQESFARTVLALVADDRPFTEAMTTERLMMTTAMKELYSLLDTIEINDDGNFFDRFRQEHRTLSIVVEASEGPIPIAETLDPNSSNYMHWYDPDLVIEETVLECKGDPVVLGPSAIALHYLLLGSLDGRKLVSGRYCPGFGGSPRAPQFRAADFDDWTMVAIRHPKDDEPTTVFYDLPLLRSARELVLSSPRVGFFSTPAFFANWPTNASNQMRVTANQALIVATGSSVDGTDSTDPKGTPGLDSAHAGDAACAACHATLDPTRSILSATWSWSYHEQLDPAWSREPGRFAFRDVVEDVRSVADFGRVLAGHPLVALGWVQKLCHYATSAACDESDPEVQRLATVFRSSHFSWNTLVRAFFTSPIVTRAGQTPTGNVRGEVVAVARRDHFCAALGARLGLTDVCGLDAVRANETERTLRDVVSGLPSDAYGRGATTPVLPNQPTPFFLAGVEALCQSVAARVVDAPPEKRIAGAKAWSGAEPEAAIDDFVSSLMAVLPGDARYSPLRAMLASHFTAALGQAGVDASEALRSTFVVACTAPTSISIGL